MAKKHMENGTMTIRPPAHLDTVRTDHVTNRMNSIPLNAVPVRIVQTLT